MILKNILIIQILITFLYASYSKYDLYQMFENKHYKKVCESGLPMIYKLKNNDAYLSIIAISCIKADMINTALRVANIMRNSKMARNNASYVANLYLIKKLLIQFIYDKIDLSNISLPKSNHFLFIIFENLSKKNYIKKDNQIIIKTKNKKFILKPLNKDNKHKIYILIIDKKTHKQYKHIYW
jgi:hypothetical protein